MQTIAHLSAATSGKQDTKVSSDELFRRSAAHDEAAFRQLFDRYYEPLCREALQVIKCKARAEEIVCDVYTSIWKRGKASSVHTNAKYYLKRAVRNRSIDYLRRQMRAGHLADISAYDTIATYDTPQQKMETQEMSDRISRAIGSLPPRGKQIFLLSRSQGLTYKDIAARLGLSIKTVETHMRRTLIQLRTYFPEVA